MAKNKFKLKPWMWILAIVVILGIWFFASYNSLVRLEISSEKAWQDVEVQYQRRFDLIPNLVETVKGYAAHEEGVFTTVTEARSQWQKAKVSGDVAGQLVAASQLDVGLGRLIAVAEGYPDLKASQNFLALQDQLEGTENRISVSRTRFNAAVADYNYKIRRIPTNIVAGLFGFERKQMFEAVQGAEEVVKVDFS
ncbi:LemA family protein [Candidatus Woesearchaeota archaeon CG10_big_fil_rev_8_21_14_0_10_37_12]|nr:MAG: LemA family protein [Candidatus Woesearchaeota archaeon CG10_big_fil_rev_8_21_14_0_10_37_12]